MGGGGKQEDNGRKRCKQIPRNCGPGELPVIGQNRHPVRMQRNLPLYGQTDSAVLEGTQATVPVPGWRASAHVPIRLPNRGRRSGVR